MNSVTVSVSGMGSSNIRALLDVTAVVNITSQVIRGEDLAAEVVEVHGYYY